MEEQINQVEEQEKFDLKKELFELAKTFIVCLILVKLLTTFVICPVRVDGNSMYPTLHDESLGIVNLFSVKFGQIERQDIVVVRYKSENESWVKRVIGLPGDRIACRNNKVYINGEVLEEPYLHTVYVSEETNKRGYFTTDFEEIILKENEYFLMGDNRVMSRDSRMVGVFHKEDIVGKDIYVFFPFEHMGIYTNSSN